MENLTETIKNKEKLEQYLKTLTLEELWEGLLKAVDCIRSNEE